MEIDETVLCRRRVIRNSITIDDDVADNVWIVGAIDTTKQRNFILKCVPNRSIHKVTEAFLRKICILSILCSDWFRSYSEFANNLYLKHHIVNHSIGFVAEDRTNTNNIEGFWSHLKSSMRKVAKVIPK